MPDKPPAERAIDAALVRSVLTTQAGGHVPRVATLPLSPVAEGWDCAVWRLGDDLAVRLPRRALGAPLILHEQFALPFVAPAIEATGIRIPLPVFSGAPDEVYPWPWSIVPWIEGTSGLDVARGGRTGWATALGRALVALHTPAPADAPANPFRGMPLSERDATVSERLAALRTHLTADENDVLASAWTTGLSVPVWSDAPVWVHGDLHPGNLVADGSELVGIIDFGDVTSGDPAYDLAVSWLAFDAAGHAAFVAATSDRYDAPTWTRARAWAASVILMLLHHSDDNPAYAQLGRDALDELSQR